MEQSTEVLCVKIAGGLLGHNQDTAGKHLSGGLTQTVPSDDNGDVPHRRGRSNGVEASPDALRDIVEGYGARLSVP